MICEFADDDFPASPDSGVDIPSPLSYKTDLETQPIFGFNLEEGFASSTLSI